MNQNKFLFCNIDMMSTMKNEIKIGQELFYSFKKIRKNRILKQIQPFEFRFMKNQVLANKKILQLANFLKAQQQYLSPLTIENILKKDKNINKKQSYIQNRIQQLKMPKIIEKYTIQQTKPLIINEIEHFYGKQRQSNKNYILKRVKTRVNYNQSQTSIDCANEICQQRFQQLTHETLILKSLNHPSIPKCLRMLKTTNNVYFVYEDYPLTSLQQKLSLKQINTERKISILINIITTLNYIHQHFVVYRALNAKNIMVDSHWNVYFTDFKNAKSCEKINPSLKTLNSAKKQRQFKNLLNHDYLDLARFTLQLFHLNDIDSEQYCFQNQKVQRLYDVMSQFLKKKSNLISLQNVVQILSDKETVKTNACTSNSSSIFSMNSKQVLENKKISKNVQIPQIWNNFTKPSSSFSLSMRTSRNNQNGIKKQQNQRFNPQLSSRTILDSTAPNNQSRKLSFSEQLNCMMQRIKKQKQTQRQTIKSKINSIMTTRKVINTLLYCMNSIDKHNDIQLIYLLNIKSTILALKQQGQIENCIQQPMSRQEKQALKELKRENLKTIKTLQIIKQSIKQLISLNQSITASKGLLRELITNEQSFQQNIQEILSKEIFHYLQKEIPQELYRAEQNWQNLSQDSAVSFDKLNLFYYLSLKLTHHTFEQPCSSQNHYQTKQQSTFKSPHFSPLDKKSIPPQKILNEVISKMNTFSQQTTIFSI